MYIIVISLVLTVLMASTVSNAYFILFFLMLIYNLSTLCATFSTYRSSYCVAIFVILLCVFLFFASFFKISIVITWNILTLWFVSFYIIVINLLCLFYHVLAIDIIKGNFSSSIGTMRILFSWYFSWHIWLFRLMRYIGSF